MNMPATADPAELANEVRALRGFDIAGVELGQGAFPNNDQLIAILKAANEAGVKVSLSHGPTQNPAGYSIDDDHARKTFVVGKDPEPCSNRPRARLSSGNSLWKAKASRT